MSRQEKFIFDMDGTLYQFDKGGEQTFAASRFNLALSQRRIDFFMNRLGLNREEAIVEQDRIDKKFEGEISLGVEAEMGIDRMEYFASTWDLDPSEFVDKNSQLREMLSEIRGRIALLTAAPRIWAVKVLAHLEIDDLFDGNIFTGEPDERKPNPIVFQNIVELFGTETANVFSIGDQEHTDIVPAKSVGLRALRIGSAETIADYNAGDIVSALTLLKGEGHI